MTERIDLTTEEAVAAISKAVSDTGGSFNHFGSAQRINAIIGAIAIVKALQDLGYTITRPTKSF